MASIIRTGKPKDATAASKLVLAYGYGRAPQHIELDHGGAVSLEVAVKRALLERLAGGDDAGDTADDDPGRD
jgi:hypothetical protein